jgi:predicted lipid-binding transport protein (Tim44 family)
MLGDFWSELFGSVGTLLNGLTQSRDREFVFVDQADLSPSVLGGGIASQPATPMAPPMWVQAKAQLESLQKADPNFLESAFLTQAARTYSAALAAEGAMNADALAGTVTPAFATCFTQRIAQWRDGGFTRVVSDVSLDPPTTFKVAIGGDIQSITVRFTGTARRFTKEDMTNLVSDGSAQPQSFTEFATFVRPAGSTTPKSAADGGPLHCPSCGAPATDGALKCAFCGASLSGTGGSWQLDHTSISAYT